MLARRLSGDLLNFWVAKALASVTPGRAPHPASFHPSSDWSHAGPLLADEWYAIEDVLVEWLGPDWQQSESFCADPLSWFMRSYVCTQFGQEVEDVAGAKPAPGRAVGATISSLFGAKGW
jgi:hypothetical protein